MEMLITMIWAGIWSVVAYFGVKKVNEKFPNLDVNPMYYAIGSFLIGILWCGLFLAYKVHEHKKFGKFFKKM